MRAAAFSHQELNALRDAREEHLSLFAQAHTDHVELAWAVSKLYESNHIAAPTRTFIAPGPGAAMELLGFLTGNDQYRTVEFSWARQCSFGEFAGAIPIVNQFEPSKLVAARCRDTYKAAFTTELQRQLRNVLQYELLRNLHFHELAAVFSASFGESRSRFMKSWTVQPGLADADWVLHYHFVKQVFAVHLPVSEHAVAFVKAGGFGLFACDVFAIVVVNPASKCDEALRLHCEDGPSVHWSDGTKGYHWHGVPVPAKLIENPGEITRGDLLAEKNAEVRRCFQEALGSKRFAELLDLVAIHRGIDRKGNEQVLYRTRTPDVLAGNYIQFAQVMCPSTGRIYFLCVPPGLKTVEEAVAWTFGHTPDTYTPVIET